ncbi:MAG: pyrroline-5-carboxylate reductase [Candidatus Margulisiibacteriota bacterium]
MIGFVGAGKMAEALISQLSPSQKVIASDKDRKRLQHIKKKYPIKIAIDNAEVFEKSDVVILAVKPQNMGEVLGDEIRNSKSCLLAGTVEIRKPLIISIAAGITLAYLQKHLPGCQVIRAMPNNPALVGMGITALAAGKGVDKKAKAVARKIFETVGEVEEVPEHWMDAVTGLSGSGPAFIYLVIEALAEAGIRLGIKKSTAEKLAMHTVLGAAHTMLKTGESAAKLRAMVTSPGGTTEQGLKALEEGALYHDLIKAVTVAAARSKELAA